MKSVCTFEWDFRNKTLRHDTFRPQCTSHAAIYHSHKHCLDNSFWRSVLHVHWKDWCWSWNSNTLATSCEELTQRKRPWCWEGLGAGGEGNGREWDGCMASPTQWAWVWVNSGSWWWTGRPGVLRFMGSQRVRHDWATELNWTLFLVEICPSSLSKVSWFLCICEYFLYIFSPKTLYLEI